MDYHITVQDEEKGPYSLSQLQSMWESGTITSDSLYWDTEAEEWKPIKELIEPSPPVLNEPSPPVLNEPSPPVLNEPIPPNFLELGVHERLESSGLFRLWLVISLVWWIGGFILLTVYSREFGDSTTAVCAWASLVFLPPIALIALYVIGRVINWLGKTNIGDVLRRLCLAFAIVWWIGGVILFVIISSNNFGFFFKEYPNDWEHEYNWWKVLGTTALAFLPPIVLYIFGKAVYWIYKGFKGGKEDIQHEASEGSTKQVGE